MITFSNGVRLVESASELPQLPEHIETLFMDYETGSGSPSHDSLDTWHHCAPAGFAMTWDEHPHAYYVPVKGDPSWEHWQPHWPQVGRAGAYAWLRDAMQRSKKYVNHNCKYDAHVYCRHIGESGDIPEMTCTVVAAKLIDSDRGFGRGTYSLDSLSRDWLGQEINQYEHALAPYLVRNKDYSRIPPDVLGEYGGQDVLTNRRLYQYILERMPEDCQDVWQTERRLTSVLLDMERTGVRVDPDLLMMAEVRTFLRMCEIEKELEQLVGRPFRPHVNEDCFEVLCGQYGLPILGRTESGNPSFDKHAMALYEQHLSAPQDVISRIMDYRRNNTLRNFFIVPYQQLHVDGVLHPNHNQCVRTGRMSCSDPNTQQLSKDAKELVIPREGCAFLSDDAQSIEFRTIAHYIQNKMVLEAFARDPDTDFHQWVADQPALQTNRKAAKTINFMIAFGGGKKKTVHVLSLNKDVVGALESKVDQMIEERRLEPSRRKQVLEQLCQERGEQLYRTYHDTLPEIKQVSRRASDVLIRRGYVRNVAGRRRHLLADHAHKSFNALNQSSAADIVKERMVALHDAYRGTPLRILLQVHDEILTEGPVDALDDPRTLRDVLGVLEENHFQLRVPIRWSVGISTRHWREASDEKAYPESTRTVERGEFTRFAHLREEREISPNLTQNDPVQAYTGQNITKF